MNLYDSPADVVRKSIVGLGLAPEAVASMAGLEVRELMGFLNGRFSLQTARHLAPVLGLNSEALASLPDYQPITAAMSGIRRVSVPFEDDEVNIWLIESGNTVIAIDCGFRANDFLHAIEPIQEKSVHLLITHAHRDHVGGLTTASRNLLASIRAPKGFGDSTMISSGDTLEIGAYKIRVIDLAGHHPDTFGYHILGPEVDAIAMGDAVFAGSIGGCPDPSAFSTARRTIEAALSMQNPEVVLLPGHGPETTLASEIRSNAFLAAWLA
jgi:hydroxyacylglutathione hydrolase